MTDYALTDRGQVVIEDAAMPLRALMTGNHVLGVSDPDQPDAPRAIYMVTAVLDDYRVPTEDPSRLESFLLGVGLGRLVAGGKVRGVLVDGPDGPGMFALETTPTLDVIHPASLR